ncbi:MAG: hemolysin family protein [Verrucomicrobiota bacterium]
MTFLAAGSLGVPEEGSWTLLVLFVCLAIGASFICSVLEAVLLSVTRPYVATLKKDNPNAGTLLEQMKEQVNRPLTAILTLNTIAHTVGAMGVGGQVKALSGGGAWEWIAGALMTSAVLILSEIIPKNLGARHWRAWGPWVALILNWLTRLMTPMIWLIELFSKGNLHRETFSRDELEVMAEMGRNEGKLHEDESRILRNLLQLPAYSVHDVMTPRVVVFALHEDSTIEEFMREHDETPFSRIPLYGENLDDIRGFILKNDALLAAAKDQDDTPLKDLARPISTLAAATSLASAFEQMITNNDHIAIVLDEFGGSEGLVTFEDIVETLLGLEIVDEADTKEDMQEFARTLWKRRASRMGIEVEENAGLESKPSTSSSSS